MGEQQGGGGVAVCSSTQQQQQPKSISKSACDECKTNESKYKCPGCPIRSCSLPCVKAHKLRTGCTGKRLQQTEFVPLFKFDDNLLLSDYNMLEDVKRIADSAKRRRILLCGKYLGTEAPFHLRRLQNNARHRRTILLFLPRGMSKRETNQTFYNNRLKSISWTIEWHFHSADIKLIDHGVHENSNLCSVIQKHLNPGPLNRPLKPFCIEPVESLKFYITQNPQQPRSSFRELDIHAPIRKLLANLVIIEYPVIHVFLPSHNPSFEVVKDIVTRPLHPKIDTGNDTQPEPKGVFFKEEEIKDHNPADPHVLDLMHKSHGKTDIKEGLVHKSIDSTNNDNLDEIVDLVNFDFDPELIDVYSSLISETNPDDFLDFEGLCDDLPSKGCDLTVEEELEEGEIVESD
uniref:box C/D snoRNA protein 1 n=1 Tax=Erigeron canadensis TaxID=72917 RepID=UPI001CB923C7|nr:box C/D snoRNA protein 1 [Erigeron canadensis]